MGWYSFNAIILIPTVKYSLCARFFFKVALVTLCAVFLFAPQAKAALTEPQIQSVLGLLTAFNVDTAVIADVNNILHGGAPATPPPTPVATDLPVIERTLYVGVRGPDVLQLQQHLILQGLLAADSATGYFGPL
ncbi:MAG: hypothetical protein G01um101456_250, partial [Parcubacteria group bacterium Gr01-1014_56]